MEWRLKIEASFGRLKKTKVDGYALWRTMKVWCTGWVTMYQAENNAEIGEGRHRVWIVGLQIGPIAWHNLAQVAIR